MKNPEQVGDLFNQLSTLVRDVIGKWMMHNMKRLPRASNGQMEGIDANEAMLLFIREHPAEAAIVLATASTFCMSANGVDIAVGNNTSQDWLARVAARERAAAARPNPSAN